MRREHDSIVIDVLDALARYDQDRDEFHVTALAARANLPHDRLRTYLDELAAMQLVQLEPVPSVTVRGRQFLECLHAWVRVQQMYGLHPRSANGATPRTIPTMSASRAPPMAANVQPSASELAPMQVPHAHA